MVAARRRLPLLLIAWEIAARWFIDPLFISPPSRVLLVARRGAGTPTACRRRCGSRFFELAVAFAIAVVIGLTVGLAVGLQPFARRSLMPIILLLYGLPQITILPLFILYFGIGPASKIAFGVTHGMFPIIDHHRRRRAEPQADPADERALDGRQPLANFALGDLPAHDPELLRRHAARHERRRCSACCSPSFTSRPPASAISPRMFTENFDPTKLFGLVAMLAAMAIMLNEIVRRAETRFSRWR